MDLDPEYEDLVHTDATALLRPKTGLKDMFIELDPGTDRAPLAKAGWTIPVQNTLPDINPDEIFSALDADTRDYLKLLVNGAGRGPRRAAATTCGGLPPLRAHAPRPRARQRRRSRSATRNLRRLVNSLNALNTELAGKDDELAAARRLLVDGVPRVRLGETRTSRRAVARPARRAAPDDRHAGQGRSASRDVLRPDGRQPAPGGARAQPRQPRGPAASPRRPTPIVRKQIRPFVRDARPLVRDLSAPAQGAGRRRRPT